LKTPIITSKAVTERTPVIIYENHLLGYQLYITKQSYLIAHYEITSITAVSFAEKKAGQKACLTCFAA
jgi:hypothetical protein